MKRFLFCESSPNFGGQENQILLQMATLENAGHFCLLACRSASKIAIEAQRRGLPWRSVGFRNSVDPSSILAIRRLIRHHRISVAFCHSGHDTNILAIAARTLWRRPVLLRHRTYQPGTPKALTYNYLVDRTFVPSEYLKRKVLGNAAIRPDRVAVLRPVLALSSLRRDAVRPLPSDIACRIGTGTKVIAHVAMLRSEKGHQLALSAVAKLREVYPELRYVIAGAGPRETDLRAQVSRLGLQETVVFAGLMLPVAPLLARADLVIMPSLEEPLGLAQLEALALGVPVAVSDAGGLPETVAAGRTGWVLPVGDLDAWVDGMRRALANPEEARTMASRGQAWVLDNYSEKKYISDLEKHLLEVSHRNKPEVQLAGR